MLLRCTILLCLLSAAVNAQQLGPSDITSHPELASALVRGCGDDLACSHRLLDAHRDLISNDLWQDLVSLGDVRAVSPSIAYAESLQVASRLNDKRLAGLAYYKLGWYEFGEQEISNAILSYEHSKQSLEEAGARRDLIYVLADLGTLYIFAADYVKAYQSSQDSLTVAESFKGTKESDSLWPDEYGIATALANLGNITKRSGDYEGARRYFQQSLKTLEVIDPNREKYKFKFIDDLWDIGQSYSDEADYLHALVYLDQGMRLAMASREAGRIAGITNSYGILYLNQRDYEKAIELFQAGVKLATAANDRFKQADMLLNLGIAYQFSHDYPSALTNLTLALDLAKQIKYSELLVLIQEALGVVYSAQGKHDDALNVLNTALSTSRNNLDKTRIAEILWRQSQVNLAKRDTLKSIENATEAINLAEQLGLKNVRYLALTELGKAYRARSQNDLAMQTFKKATDQVEEMRNKVSGLENERQLFFEDKVVPYHEVVDMLISAKKDESNELALLTAESAKARVLLDVFSAGRIDLERIMSDSEKDEERKLSQRIIDLNNQIGTQQRKVESAEALVPNLNEQLRIARSRYETFQNSLYVAHPEVRTKRTQATTATLANINALLKPNEAFLEYIVTQSKTYLLALTKSDSGSPVLRAYPIQVSESEIVKRTRNFRDLIVTRGGFADDARQLYDLLLKPAEQQLAGRTSISIIPDGILWDLPFQALEPRDGHYLLEDYAISYAPSLSVLNQVSGQRQGDAPRSLLAFGNPTMPRGIDANINATYRGENFGPLPDAEMEVGALKDIWDLSSSSILIGKNARKKIFLTEAPKYSIIHLATHGILDDASPLYSRLVLTRAEDDPNDDGLLEAREIMQLNLHADLVVLSACQTARGRIGAGEGIVGMSWAFFVAGVPTMVASQWKVDSPSTAKLMIDFHKRLRDDSAAPSQTMAMALQHAELNVLKDPRYRHPYFWAGFVVLGKNSSLSPRTNFRQ